MIRDSFDPLHARLALVIIAATLPLLPHSTLPVIADHGDRIERTCIKPNPFFTNWRMRIRRWFHFYDIHLGQQFHACPPVLDTALAAACPVHPVRLVEVGAMRRAAEHG